MKRNLKVFFFLLILSLFSLPASSLERGEENAGQLYAVYLTGIGCPACKYIEPFLLSETLAELPQLTIIEYEIYQARHANHKVSQEYFNSFLKPEQRSGVPALILNEKLYVGPLEIKDAVKELKTKPKVKYPLPNGSLISSESLFSSQLPGRPRLWTKNRVFILEEPIDPFEYRSRDTCIRNLIQAKNITSVLRGITFSQTEPKPVSTSRGEIEFENAVKIGNWRIQWDGVAAPDEPTTPFALESLLASWLPLILAFFLGSLLTILIRNRKKIKLLLKSRKKEVIVLSTSIIALIAFFVIALNISSTFLRDLGYQLPLPIFTFIIALVDGFNPCNIFVLTVLLTLLISSSASRRRFYLVGFIFILIVFGFYLLFMAAWLNIFEYLHFAGPLRVIIAVIAILAGLINCKEFIFFKKGPSLMISEKHKDKLYAKMRNLTEIVNKGSLPLLIGSSTTLAIFSSLIEIPCTAGFPIIYTSILSKHVSAGGVGYFSYLIFYNLIYIFPLLAIISILGFTFQTKKISQRQVQIIKLIGGIIMILLGIILLTNPDLIGAAI